MYVGVPVQEICHSFHKHPQTLVSFLITSNTEFSFTSNSGALLVSFHSSTSGVNFIIPENLAALSWLRVIVFVAYLLSTVFCSVNGRVIKSLFLEYPLAVLWRSVVFFSSSEVCDEVKLGLRTPV